MNSIEAKVDDHEHRIVKLEVSGARLDERLNALVKSTNNLKWSMFAFTFLMLLTMIYQILGPQGYKDVTGTIVPIQQ